MRATKTSNRERVSGYSAAKSLQISLHLVECWRERVLHDGESRLKLTDDSSLLAPKSAVFSSEPVTATSDSCTDTCLLTGEASADDIDVAEFTSNGSDILVPPHQRPVLFEHAPAKRIDFYLPFDLESGPLEPEIKPANSSKEASDR